MVVADFDPDNGTLTVKDGKGSKKRNIFLGNNATRLFTLVCEGRKTDERIFLKSNGSKWGNNHAQRPLQRAREAAAIPHFSFHVLRHSYCSLYLMAGGNEFDLMKQLGHSTTQQISANYGHLANQHRQDEARACEPSIPDIAATEATLH
jgi:integrase